MKYSAFYLIVAGLGLGAVLLPPAALAEKRTPFEATQDFTCWASAMDPALPYAFDVESTVVIYSEESRVAGSATYLTCAVDLNTDVPTYWGKLLVSNEGGAWEGYWTGTEADGFAATLAGSGGYEGLVSRWRAPLKTGETIVWRGYIVENGPGDVPLKISGWREEEVAPIPGVPFMVKATSFNAGAGRASHIGIFTDIKEIGLMDFSQGISRGMGAAQAANGDTFTWVSRGGMNSKGQFEFRLFFAGGTGRFEHAVGSVAGQATYTTPSSGTYTGTGKIRF